MKWFAFLFVWMTSALLSAQVVPLWPDGQVPGKVTSHPETVKNDHVYNVSVPTIAFFPAANPDQRPLPTLLVAPGGGYGCQAYTKEGTEIAQWLNTQGFHAAVLKYRIPGDRDGALMDARQAIKVLQSHADTWQIDTTRLGMIGFSAGAHLTTRVLAHEHHGLACALLIYPAYLSTDGITLVPDVIPTVPTVPTFITQCGDDRAFVLSSIAYTSWLLKRNRPVAYHLYTRGGHGYGLQKPISEEAAQWRPTAEQWLRTQLQTND